MKKLRRGGRADDEDEDRKVDGEHGKGNAARRPRKSGGGAGPFSAAHSGTPPSGHKVSC